MWPNSFSGRRSTNQKLSPEFAAGACANAGLTASSVPFISVDIFQIFTMKFGHREAGGAVIWGGVGRAIPDSAVALGNR